MRMKRVQRGAFKKATGLALCVLIHLLCLVPSLGQTAGGASPDLASKLAAIEKAIDAKREQLHIPGASLVIVKDDKILDIKGMGVRDVANKLPVTPDTIFAIGSSTKAFTAMTVMMSVDDGKLALSDSPKKYIPYFKMRDPEADSKITISDLLCHRSGLGRTDLAWYTNKLSAEDTIRLVSEIKPTAKFGEKWQYQNVMFLVAGQCVANVQKAPWRSVVTKRILKPLGMKASNTSIRELVRTKDHALGYSYDEDKKETVLLPYHDLPVIAPAGAINSNARDMAQWLRLMLGRGVFEGKRLVSENSFAELYKKRISIGGNVDYGYGWFLRDWNGHQVVEHGGNIDGFNAQVALMPDQNLGFVLLTNVSASPLGSIAMNAVWDNLVAKPQPESDPTSAAGEKVAPELEVGTYRLSEANLDLVVAYKDGKLTLHPTGQPEFPLTNVAGRRYKVDIADLDGVFATFRPAKDRPGETELFFEQSGAKFICKRVTPSSSSEEASYSGPLKDLLGKYHSDKMPAPLEVSVRAGKVALIVPGQPSYPLSPKPTADEYALGGLPETFVLVIHRDISGKVTGALLKQPPAQGDLELRREQGATTVKITADELMPKVIEVMGGEANLKRHKTMTVKYTANVETQGLLIQGVTYARAPNEEASVQAMYAMKKKIGVTRDYFDGKEGGSESSFTPASQLSGRQREEKALSSAMFPEMNWKTLFKTVAVTGTDKVGDEEVYVVEMKPEKGPATTDYISQKTYRVIQRKSHTFVPQLGSTIDSIESYDDFRTVDGVLVPFRRTGSVPGMGEVVTIVKEVKFDTRIPDRVFRATSAPPARE